MKYKVDRTAQPDQSQKFRVNVGTATGPRGITANVLHIVRHGADANATRPAEADTVLWIGSVEPNNAVLAEDIWIDTT